MIVTTSALTFEGLSTLQQTIQQLALDETAFPHVSRELPTKWRLLANMVEEERAHKHALLPWAKYQAFAQRCSFVSDDACNADGFLEATQFLHDTGVILLSREAGAHDHVVVRPVWLVRMLRLVVRATFAHMKDLIEVCPVHNPVLLRQGDKETTNHWTRFAFFCSTFVR